MLSFHPTLNPDDYDGGNLQRMDEADEAHAHDREDVSVCLILEHNTEFLK